MSRTTRHSICVVFAVAIISLGGCRRGQVGPVSQPYTQPDKGNFTILLYVSPSLDHVERIERYRTETEKDTGWEGVFVVHDDKFSELYWGRYNSRSNAEKSLRKATQYRTPTNIDVFRRARIVEHPHGADGPPEWDLRNADGVHTVAVAVFYNDEMEKVFNRKQLALEYCLLLREQGHEAYYHHGKARSTVSIGAFPDSALRVEKIRGETVENKTVQDPRMKQIMKEFPYLLINGGRRQVGVPSLYSAKGQWVDRPSAPVLIPK